MLVRGRAGLTLLELMVVTAVLAILGTVGVGIARYAIERSNQAVCMTNLRNLGAAARQYQTEENVYPTYAGGLFWKVLYVADDAYDRELDHFICPATGDRNLDDSGTPAWVVGDYTPPLAGEVSYAGPSSARGVFRQDSALGSDDDDPAGESNHRAGINVLYNDNTIRWFEHPESEKLRAGTTPNLPEAKAIGKLQN